MASIQFAPCREQMEWLQETAEMLGTDIGTILGVAVHRLLQDIDHISEDPDIEKRFCQIFGDTISDQSSELSECVDYAMNKRDLRRGAAQRRIWMKRDAQAALLMLGLGGRGELVRRSSHMIATGSSRGCTRRGRWSCCVEEFEAERHRRSTAANQAIDACLRGEIPKAAALTKIDQLSDHLRHGLRQGLAMLGWTEEVLAWIVRHRSSEWGRFVRLWDGYHQRIREGEEEAKEEWLQISKRKCDWARRESGAAAGKLFR
ncbi:MAG: hypothetical protein V3T83_21975 [Acidobacteriota bacterium]